MADPGGLGIHQPLQRMERRMVSETNEWLCEVTKVKAVVEKALGKK